MALAAGDDAEGLGLAGLVVVGVAQPAELLGDVADELVEGGQVVGVTGGLEPGGAGELARPRVGEGDVPPGPGGLFLRGLLLGREPGGGEGDEPLDGGEPEPVDPAGELLVDPPGGLERQGAGVGGDPAGLPGRHLAGLDLRAQQREPVPQVEGVRHQRHRGLGGDPHRRTELLGHERAPPPGSRPRRGRRRSRDSPGRPASPQVAVPGLGRGRVHARTTGRRAAACAAAPPGPPLGLGDRREQAGGVEVLDLDRRCADCLHGPTQPGTTDSPDGPRSRCPQDVWPLVVRACSWRHLGNDRRSVARRVQSRTTHRARRIGGPRGRRRLV